MGATCLPVHAKYDGLDLGNIEKSKGDNWCWANAGTALLNYIGRKYDLKFSQEDFFKLVYDKEPTYQVKNSDRLVCGNLSGICYGVMKGLRISGVSQKINFYITKYRANDLTLQLNKEIKVCNINEELVPYIKFTGVENLSHIQERTIKDLLQITIKEKKAPLIVYVAANSDKKLDLGPSFNEYHYGYSSQNTGEGHIIIVNGLDFDKEVVFIQDPGGDVSYTMKIKQLDELAFKLMWIEVF